MLNDKRMLYGFGAGLIVGAILLQLMNFGRPQDLQPEGESGAEGTVGQLQSLAEDLGYVIYPGSERRYSEDELNERIAAALEQARTDQPAAENERSERSEPLEIEIKYGMGSSQVGEALFEAGLIDDVRAFEDELRRLRLAGRIQVGKFTFLGKPELSQLIETITSR